MGNSRYAAIVEYDGTGLGGWQIQPNSDTLQARLEAALQRLYGEPMRVTASGRTDAGVHARGQVVHFDAPGRYHLFEMISAINHFLDERMALHYLREVAPGFHARFDAVRKEYSYTVLVTPVRPVFGRDFAWHLREPLSVERMAAAIAVLAGDVDVAPFTSEPSRCATTVRHFFRADVAALQDGQIEFRFCANGFLYNLVRALVGTLVAIGREKLDTTDFARIIRDGDRSAVPGLAPPQGLVLEWVEYEGYPDLKRKASR
jgi:tRNA pseudouridine38-40 synthase